MTKKKSVKKDQVAIGLDLGGTKIAAGLITEGGELLSYHRIPSFPENVRRPEDLVERLIFLIVLLAEEAKLSGFRVKGIGLASAGPLNALTGELINPTNMPLVKKVPLCSLLLKELRAKKMNHPLYFQNDAIAAALGEQVFGKAKGAKVSAMITIGTGIGSGVLINGQPMQNRGVGSEWGLMSLGSETVEDISAGPALLRRAQSFTKKKIETMDELPVSVLKSERFRKKVFAPTIETIALLCRNLSLGLAPDIISFSGGVLDNSELFWRDLQHTYKDKMRDYSMFQAKLVKSHLKHVGVWGAAALVFKNVSRFESKK